MHGQQNKKDRESVALMMTPQGSKRVGVFNIFKNNCVNVTIFHLFVIYYKLVTNCM